MKPSDVILPKSPLDIMGLFLTVVRARFTEETAGADFPWLWKDNVGETKIHIEAGSGDDITSKDVRPSIFVDRGPIVFPKVAIGDFAGGTLHTGERAFYTTGTGQMNIDCVSKSRGESAILGELVQSFVLMSSDIILQTYNLRDVTPVTLGGTEVWEKDDRLFNTRVTSQISYDVKWGVKPNAGKIAEIIAEMTVSSGNVFANIASTSLNKSSNVFDDL